MADPFNPPLTDQDIDAAFQGRFVVLDILPPGGQGALFIVSHPPNKAVLKIYQNAHNLRGEREAFSLENLDCDHIVRLHEWGRTQIRGEECIFTLTEYIEGASLFDELKTRSLSEAGTRQLGYCIADAISALWSPHRIVHRDINPKNIIVRPNNDAVLIDLGIARHRNLTRLTTWGFAWGTEGYMSPEQAAGRRGLTFRSDFFALGIVLYEAASGFHPFNIRQDLIGKVFPTALNSVCQVSQDLANIVHSLMEADPLNRPRNPSLLADQLRMGI